MANSCIGCNVTECKHHAKSINQCTLDHIEVITHDCGCHGMTKESTDCGSFEQG